MGKVQAEILAIKIATKIVTTDPKSIMHPQSGSEAANLLADFIKTLSSRLESDMNENVHSDIID